MTNLLTELEMAVLRSKAIDEFNPYSIQSNRQRIYEEHLMENCSADIEDLKAIGIELSERGQELHELRGHVIGEGSGRCVYQHAKEGNHVIKGEYAMGENWNGMQNKLEWDLWDYVSRSGLKRYFAPCHEISDCGVYLVQEKAGKLDYNNLPDKLPGFFHFLDGTTGNLGLINGNVVLMDYGVNTENRDYDMDVTDIIHNYDFPVRVEYDFNAAHRDITYHFPQQDEDGNWIEDEEDEEDDENNEMYMGHDDEKFFDAETIKNTVRMKPKTDGLEWIRAYHDQVDKYKKLGWEVVE